MHSLGFVPVRIHALRGRCWGKAVVTSLVLSNGFVTLRAREEVTARPQGKRLEGALQRILGNGFCRAAGGAGAAGRRGNVSPAQSLR